MHVLNAAGQEKVSAEVGGDLSPRAWLPDGNLLAEKLPRDRNLTILTITASGEIVRSEELGPIIDYTYFEGGGEKGPYYYATQLEPGKLNGLARISAIGKDGKKLWTRALAGAPTPSFVSKDGTFFHCCDQDFIAIGADGKELWTAMLPKGTTVWPCVASILGELNSEIYFQGCKEFIALGSKDGQMRAIPFPFKRGGNEGFLAKMLPDGSLVMMEDFLYRIDSHGRLIWRFAPDMRGDGFKPTFGSIALAANGDVYAESNLYEVYGITPEGRKRWVYRGKYIGSNARLLTDIPGMLLVEREGTFELKFALPEKARETAQ